jgi:hypothetical protein
MKRFLCCLFALVLLPVVSLAELPDLSGLSFDELVQLREQVNLSLWQTDEWERVEVPAGVYKVGRDIPAGHWTITPAPESFLSIWYGDILNDSGTDAGYGWDGINGFVGTFSTRTNEDGSWKNPSELHHLDIVIVDGWYIKTSGTVYFSPYAGTPDLGFKKKGE